MQQVCSNLRCSAIIAIPEGQEATVFDRKSVCEKCYGKPLCAKCDRLLHTPVPTIPARHIKPKAYEEPEEELIYTYLPRPKPGRAIRRVEFSDGEGSMRSEYVSCRVEPEKKQNNAKLVQRVTKFLHFT
ncbi:hypothetical protein BDR07DRAFT_1491679 [Suillus spraguei]|nr:hypothetical protein BDR07DRAFT_1491679 [Suillus spraguei]